MPEQHTLLHNMSSASRSTVSYSPHHVDPPRTRATGTRTRETDAVRIRIGLHDYGWSYEYFLKQLRLEYIQTNECACEEQLRTLAETTITEFGLIGCMILVPEKEVMQRKNIRIYDLQHRALAFAMLTKSSDQLFIAAKTPNLTPELIQRTVFTFDSRIAAIVRKGQPPC